MKVACIQLSSTENYNKNCKEILKYINIAISKKTDFIITPETSSIITEKLLYNALNIIHNPPTCFNDKILQ